MNNNVVKIILAASAVTGLILAGKRFASSVDKADRNLTIGSLVAMGLAGYALLNQIDATSIRLRDLTS